MADSTPIDDPALDAVAALIAAVCDPDEAVADGLWLRVRMGRLDPARRAGWKLHLSAAAHRYPAFLQAALPTLLDLGHPFKIARALDVVEDLNDGQHGLGQVGKVVTVYPPDEAAAVVCAERLAAALSGFDDAPVVPGDLRFSPVAPVYFRFGPFDARTRIDPMGRRRRVLVLPDGGEVIDPADGGTAETPAPRQLPNPAPPDHLAFLRDDYLLLQVIHVSAKGVVAVALPRHTKPALPVLLKSAKHGAQGDRLGRDAAWALRREHALLLTLAGLPGFPPAGTLLEGPEAVAQIRPWIMGDTLWSRWTEPGAATDSARARLCADLGALAGRVAAAHARGIVLRDLSPGNVLIAEDGPVLLDVELAARLGASETPYRRGTPGFHDPARPRGAEPGVADDHYALLAMAWMVVRGEQSVWFPQGLHDCAAPGASLYRDDEFGRAFAAAWAVRGTLDFPAAYEGLLASAHAPQSALPGLPAGKLVAAFIDHVDAALRAVVDAAPSAERVNVYSGVAGLLREAMEVAPDALRARLAAHDLDAVSSALVEGAREVLHIPGYHFGAAGVAAVLARLGVFLGLDRLTRAGIALLRAVDPADPAIPDLCQGQAGLLLAALEVVEATGDPDARTLAMRTCDHLIELAQPTENGGMQWPWPTGDYGSLSGQAAHGHAHGSAGIVAVLSRAAATLGHTAARAVAASGLRQIVSAIKSTQINQKEHKKTQTNSDNPDAGTAWWPVAAGDDTCWNAWCHGTPGILVALAGLDEPTITDEIHALLPGALRGMAACNHGGWCLCHGLASRVWAWSALWAEVQGRPALVEQANLDVSVLMGVVALGPVSNEAQEAHAAGPPGLMTGPAGALAACLRFIARDV